ncbi:transglutaminase family protein [Rhodobacter sp. KR11]|uniref:transglutaminase family protein n=1 Tax=Rhodobacter sp. KR11 TaxID=2974588 RepID=UPI0022227A9A|nr:transglutaminase family protein [Rhodobacter sp. KR11]MCW1920251.1 transglutaminase family protein [Rhodobacter sp. KR11]
MIYDLKLVIAYEFDRPTGGGRQHLRITPADLPGLQSLLSHEISISPPPKERRSFTDFWGTEVTELVLPPGMTDCKITLKARVLRQDPEMGLDISPAPVALATELAEVTRLGSASPQHFLTASPRIAPDAAIAAFAAKAMAAAPTVQSAIEALGRALHGHMTFDPKATEVDTPPAVAFALRRGVCQDLAQIMIAGLRSQGIPAAYVAGYLRTLPPPGKPRLEGADAMHAWVAAWAGVQAGWLAYDPTNACWVAADHLIVGQGRDYGDVAPVVGSLRTEGGQRGSHAVDLVASSAKSAASPPAPSPAAVPPPPQRQ